MDNLEKREQPIGGGPRRILMIFVIAIVFGVCARIALGPADAASVKPPPPAVQQHPPFMI